MAGGWENGEKRRLVATVERVNHLPQKDMMGKCDPFVVFEIDGKAVGKTSVKSKVYDAEWNERVELPWVDKAGSLAVRVMDHDGLTSNDEVGICSLDADKIYSGEAGTEQALVVGLVDSKGKPIVGKDKSATELAFRITVEKAAKVSSGPRRAAGDQQDEGSTNQSKARAALDLPAEEEAWVANERRRVVVTVVGASHLPKMDMLMGKCDPFAVVRMDGKEQKTRVVKGSYDPVWNERLEMGWRKSGPAAGSLMRVALYDEDLTGKDEIGEATLDSALLYRLRVGEEREVVLGVVDGKGSSVIGHDKMASEVKVVVKLERSVLGLAALSDSQEAWVPNERRRIVMTLVSARSLPKMDLMGLCDPFVILEVSGKEVQSGVRKNTLSPDWNERLELPWVTSAEAAADFGNINVKVMDWDSATANDLVGEAQLSGRVIFLRKIGVVSDVSLELSLDGKSVVGKDGKVSEVRCKLTIESGEVQHLPSAAEEPKSGMERRLVIVGASARHLPKMDLLGLSDPFLEIKFGSGGTAKTGIRKSNLNPDWDERIPLSWVASASSEVGPVHVRVMDWDAGNKNDEIGEATVSAEIVAALLAKQPGQVAPDVKLLVTSSDGSPVTGKDGKASEIRLRFTVEGCEEWLARVQEEASPVDTEGKRFPEGGGRALGYAVDATTKHSNWTKPHVIVVNSDKGREARLRALAGAEARRVAASSAMSLDRDKQALLSGAAEARAAAQLRKSAVRKTPSSVLNAKRSEAGDGKAVAQCVQPLATHESNDGQRVELSEIMGVARNVLSASFMGEGGGIREDRRDPYPVLQTRFREEDVSADFAGGADHARNDCSLLARARALLSVAGVLSAPGISNDYANCEGEPRHATAEATRHSSWHPGAVVHSGSVGDDAGLNVGDHMAALSRIRETIRGLSSGKGTSQTAAPCEASIAPAVQDFRRDDSAVEVTRRDESFSSDGLSDSLRGESGKPNPPPKGGEMMPFEGEGSTVTLPSVAASASGDSIFASAPPRGAEARGPSGSVGDLRVCISDLRVKGIGAAGEGVSYCLKLGLAGFKARTAQVEQRGSEIRWYDRCEFEFEEGAYPEGGRGLVISTKLVKSRKGKGISSASVDSIVGSCCLKVKALDGMARRAHWQWHSLIDAAGNKTGAEVYAGIEALVGVSEGPMIDLPPSLQAAPNLTAPRRPAQPPPPGFANTADGLARVREAGTGVDEAELEAVPEVRSVIALQCAWRARNARARLRRAEAWRAYGFGAPGGVGGAGRMTREEGWKGGERKEGAAGLYSRRRKSPPKIAPPPALQGLAPQQRSFETYVGQAGHPAAAASNKGRGGARRALALSNAMAPYPAHSGAYTSGGAADAGSGGGVLRDLQQSQTEQYVWDGSRSRGALGGEAGRAGIAAQQISEAVGRFRTGGDMSAPKVSQGFADLFPIGRPGARGDHIGSLGRDWDQGASRVADAGEGERLDRIRSAAMRLLG